MREEAPSVAVHEGPDETALREQGDALREADLIVDAVVGTGFQPPLRGVAVAVRDLLANSSTPAVAPVVAIDLPSGWDADSTEETAPDAFRASAVVTFTRPKRAHVFGNLTGSASGLVVVAEIGSPLEAVTSELHLHWAGAAKAIAEQPRAANSNKGMYGHVLVVGGSYGTAGAPSMASLAAVCAQERRLVTAAVPRSIVGLIAGVAPELMLSAARRSASGAWSRSAALRMRLVTPLRSSSRKGITANRHRAGALPAASSTRHVVAGTKLAMVVDADAL